MGQSFPNPDADGDDASSSGADDDGSSQPGSSFISRLMRRAFGGDDSGEDQNRLAQLDELADTIDQKSMLRNVLHLSEMRIDHVMVPRADIVAVPADVSLAEVLDVFRDASHSRLPVYRETLDDPIGFVHLKDLALRYGFADRTEEGDETPFDLADHIRRALFAPPSMPADALLRRMQAARVHMALVIDEYGGVDGLVTIEDLVEEIVGEIEDEHDEDEGDFWVEEKPGVYLCDARADMSDFEAATGLRLADEEWEEDVDTLGGLVFMMSNRVPGRGEVISHPDGHEFEVVDADPRRINRLRVTLAGAVQGALAQAAE